MSRENRTIIIAGIVMLLMTLIATCVNAQNTDFEQWSTRSVKESAIFGGQTKTLYDLPNHWATSNTHAHVMGTDKAAVSVYPVAHGSGKACRMQVEQISFTVMGVPVNAVAAGSIYLGETNEPTTLKDANEPMSVLNMNYEYSFRPKALHLDYRCEMAQSTDISQANASKKVRHYTGRDGAEIIVLLQRRWEDSEGRIHAERVATAWERIYTSAANWVADHSVPLLYGDIRSKAESQDYMALNSQSFMCRNSRGNMVVIEEEGYNANATPTHLILMISSGCQPAFCGHVGNWLEVDNVCLR